MYRYNAEKALPNDCIQINLSVANNRDRRWTNPDDADFIQYTVAVKQVASTLVLTAKD